MATLANLKYTKSHEWVLENADGTVTVGITDYAQQELGDLVFVNLPQAGDDVTAGEAFGDVESVKAVSDVVCPVSGVVAEVNEELLDAPQLINETPYDAWMIKVENVSETEELLSAEEYEAFIQGSLFYPDKILSREDQHGTLYSIHRSGAAGTVGGHWCGFCKCVF